MQAIALRPGRGQLLAQLAGLAAMSLAMLFAPVLSLPVALIAPLFVCPLAGHRQQWFAYALALAPMGVSLVGGNDAAYSVCLALPCALCALIAEHERRGKSGGTCVCLAYIAAYAAALGAIMLFASRALGGGLCERLSQLASDAVGGSRGASGTLYSLATGGIINVPYEYRNARLISYALDPALKSQLLMSLRLTVRLTLGALLPRLYVELSIALGLFTYLRGQKLNRSFLLVKTHAGKVNDDDEPQTTTLARSAGFMALDIPRTARGAMFAICVGSLVLPIVGGGYASTLGALCGNVFECVFKLVGAAVLTSLLTARKPELKNVFGALAALAYVLLPTLIMLVGVLDQLLHFRRNTLLNQEEE